MATLPKEAPEFKVRKAEAVVELLSETIDQVRTGELRPRVANAVGCQPWVILKKVVGADIQIMGMLKNNKIVIARRGFRAVAISNLLNPNEPRSPRFARDDGKATFSTGPSLQAAGVPFEALLRAALNTPRVYFFSGSTYTGSISFQR